MFRKFRNPFMTVARHEAELTSSFRETQRKLGRLAAEALSERDAARKVLREIADLETPACANIGKRMAARARRALLQA